MMTYYKTPPNVCPVCKNGFTNKCRLKRHKMHNNIKPCKCNLCTKGSYHACHLRKHVIHHTRVKRKKGYMCDQQFKGANEIQSYNVAHSEDKQYQCTVCHDIFQQEHLLQTHLMTHLSFGKQTSNESREISTSDEQVCQCDIWETQIRSFSCHRDQYRTKQYQCAVCKIRFPVVCNLKGHMLSHLRMYSKTSGKCFAVPDNLNTHTRINSRLKPYMCNVCKKSFIFKHAYKTHILAHPRVKPFQPVICMNTFAEASHSKQKRLIHSNQKLYRCDICNKTFVRFVNLRKHMSIHSGYVQHSFSTSKIRKERKNHIGPHSFTPSKSRFNQYRVRSIHTDQRKNIKICITSLKFDNMTNNKNNFSHAKLKQTARDKGSNKSTKQCSSKHCLSADHSNLENELATYSSEKHTTKFDNSDSVMLYRTFESRKIDTSINTDTLTGTTNSTQSTHQILKFIDTNKANYISKDHDNTYNTIKNNQAVPNSSKSTQTTLNRNCKFFVAKPTIGKKIEVPLNFTETTKTNSIQNSHRFDHSCKTQIIPYIASLSGVADKRTSQEDVKSDNPTRAKNTQSSSKSAKSTKSIYKQIVENVSSSTELNNKQSGYVLPIKTRSNTYYLRNTKATNSFSQNCASTSESKNEQNSQICENVHKNRDPKETTKLAKLSQIKSTQNDIYLQGNMHATQKDSFDNNIPTKTRKRLCSSDTENPIQINQGGIYCNYIIKLHSSKIKRMEDLVFLVKDIEK